MKRSIIAVFFFLFFTFNVFGLTIKDDIGRTLNISNVKSIVVLSPAACDILEEIGASDFIVGYPDYATKPNFKAVNVGAFGSFNVEQIVSLKPDLVIIPKFTYERYNLKALKALGINVFVFEPNNIGDIVRDAEKFGIITNRIKQSKKAIHTFYQDLNKLHCIKQKPTVAFVVWLSPIIVAGDDTFISNAITVAGGKNIIGKNGWPQVTSEYLINKNPQYLIVNSRLKKIFLKQDKLLDYFYKKNRVVFIDSSLIERPSFGIIEGINILNNYFYENCNNCRCR